MYRLFTKLIYLFVLLPFASDGQIVNYMFDTICSGDNRFGYGVTGIYRDTFKTTTVDSIRVLDLTVIPRHGSAPAARWFNTGTNGTGGTLPALTPDLKWKVGTSIGGPYNSAVVMSYVPPNYSPSIWPDCAWISHSAATPGSHSSNMLYYYRIDFDLPCMDSCGNSFSVDSSFCLMLDILVDNAVMEVYVNGIPQSGNMGGVIPPPNPYGYVGFQNAQRLSVTLCSGWKPGNNTLIFEIASGAPYAGFLCQASVNAPPSPPSIKASFDIDPVVGGASSSDTGCAPFTVHFLNSSVSATGFLWDFGDGSPQSTLDSPTHTFMNPGSYTVTLIASSTLCGLPDTLTKVITVFDYPNVDLGPDLDLCADSVLLQPKQNYVDVRYRWSNGGTDRTLTATSSGTYWLDVDKHGCITRDSMELVLNYAVRVDLGNDTSLCDRDIPLILYANQPANAHLTWSNGLSDTLIRIVRTGTYWLHSALNGCEASDTVFVKVVPTPYVELGSDTTICEQSPLSIGMTVPGATYNWNTGASTPNISVDKTGEYILTVNLEGCVVRDTINIEAMPDPKINLGVQDICPEETIVLDATYNSGSTYEWSTGETTPEIAVTAAGDYWVKIVSAHQCIGYDTAVLNFYPKPDVSLGHDTVVCKETPLKLTPFAINTDSLVWSTGQVGRTATISYEGTYIVTAYNKCGDNSDTIDVKQVYCDIMIPDAFTPNGDGKNDVFRVVGNIDRLKGFRLMIINRWGKEVFLTTDKIEGWDGTFKGEPLGMDTYYYLLEYNIDGQGVQRKGSFHLIR